MNEEENIKVVVRIRPLQVHEKKEGDVQCVKAISDNREVQVKVGPLDAQVTKLFKITGGHIKYIRAVFSFIYLLFISLILKSYILTRQSFI